MFDKRRFASGDREYVHEVVRGHEGMVLTVCRVFALDRQHADDLAQEVWAKACSTVLSFKGGSFKAWLKRLATNVCLDDARTRQKRAERFRRYARDRDPDTASHPDPLAEVERRERTAVIGRALEKLSDGERRALVMRIFEGREPSEIADVMGVAPATVRSHVRHGLNRLRRMMEDPDDELSRYGTSS